MPHQIFMCVDKIPQRFPFSRVNNPRLSSYTRSSSTFIIFAAFHWTWCNVSNVCPFLQCVHFSSSGEPRTQHHYPGCESPVLSRGRITCLELMATLGLMQSQETVCFLLLWGQVVGSWSTRCSPWSPGPSLTNCFLATCWLCWCLELLLPKCMIWNLLFLDFMRFP